MKNYQLIHFTEKNVDGCGTDAELLLAVETNEPLTKEHQQNLARVIEDIRHEWEPEECDTDSVVEEAMTRIFGENARYHTVTPDISIVF